MTGQDYRKKAQFPPGSLELTNGTSFSGADVSVMFVLPSMSPGIELAGRTMDGTQLQTLTISSATSVAPVRGLGRAKALSYNKGARTFAGSMVFTVLAKDPFQEIQNIDALSNSVRGDGHWHIDQMAPFDIVIMCANEMGETGLQVIHDVSIMNWGTTYSIDDMYIESTYSYIAEHVTPFISTRLGAADDLRVLDDIEAAMQSKAKTDAASLVSNRLRDEFASQMGPYTAAQSNRGFVKNNAQGAFWADFARNDIAATLTSQGFMHPGKVSFFERFYSAIGTPPELPSWRNYE